MLTAQAEAANLRKTISIEAEKLATAEVMKINAEVVKIEQEKKALEAKLKKDRKERQEAIERGVVLRLKEKDDEIARKVNQITGMEHRIELLKAELNPLDRMAADAVHHKQQIAKVDTFINSAALAVIDAFDPDFCTAIPFVLLEEWSKGIKKIRGLADLIAEHLNQVNNVQCIEKDVSDGD